MKSVEAIAIITDLASQQSGMVTAAQAKEAGVSGVTLNRIADKSILERVRNGVYLVAGTGWTDTTEVRAQWLALDPKRMADDRLYSEPGAVVSHVTAAELHQIGDLNSTSITFTVPRRRQTRQTEVTFHTAQLAPEDWEVIDGLPVTTVRRTLNDLASAGHEPDHLVDLMRDARRRGKASSEELADIAYDLAAPLDIDPPTPAAINTWLRERVLTSPVTQALDAQAAQISSALQEAMRPISMQLQQALAELLKARHQIPDVHNLPPQVNLDHLLPNIGSLNLQSGSLPKPPQPLMESAPQAIQKSAPHARDEDESN